jgi:hypothetical protein
MTFDHAVALLERARTPGDVFGGGDPARTYRRLAKLVHPDVAPSREVATLAFARLAELWEQHRRGPILSTRRHTYHIGRRIATGDITDVVEVSYPDGRGVLKLARDPRNNDLLAREAAALTRLSRDGEARHRAYVPVLIESFIHRDAGSGADRAANVLNGLNGFQTVAGLRRAHPDGLDSRDCAWIWRRLLVAIGFAHRAGVVHGAVLPDHVLVDPSQRGLVLIDWCYSTIDNSDVVPAIVGRYRAWYPPEVAARRSPTPATDIHLATRCLTDLAGSRMPEALRRFARGCTLPSPAARPKDAWRLLGELDEALERLYGDQVSGR